MSPAVLLKTQMIFNNLSHWAIGCYCLEWLLSLKFEWSVLTGQRAFRYPMLLYFYTKWAVLSAFIGMLVAFNIASPINCQALYSTNQYFGNTGIAASSTLLMLRTFAIWNQNKFVVIPLVLLALGQWGIAFYAVTTVKAHYEGGVCAVGAVSDLDLDIIYLYTMFLDAVVLIMTTIGLVITPGRSNLWRLLLSDGILFFGISFLVNTVPAVLLLVNLNPVINIMFSIPAVGASASVACRSFVRISDYARPAEGSRSNGSNVQWTSTRVNNRAGAGIATIGTWGKKLEDPSMTVNVTTTQTINLDEYPANMHPLDEHNNGGSNDDISRRSFDKKLGPYAV